MEILRMMAADRLSRGEWNLVLDSEAAECLERECFVRCLGRFAGFLLMIRWMIRSALNELKKSSANWSPLDWIVVADMILAE